MRIVFIIDQVYLHGGIERVLSIKANYFASQADYKIHILTTEHKGKEACYAFDSNIVFEDLGVNYDRKRSYFHPINLLKLPGHIRKTKSALKKIQPDIVVVCSHSTDTYFMPFIRKHIPKVKEFHYSKSIEKNKRASSNLLKKSFIKFADYVESKYDRLIILNKDEAGYYKSNNTVVIPNPLTFYPEKISDLTEKRIIAAGRIAPVKGYDILIDIWKLVEDTDWKLDIFGDGPTGLIKQLQDKINDYGLQDSIQLRGSTNKIQEEMLNSSLFAMTSHNECFPLVLLEAQACGLPIISFDCPYGPRNIIDDTTGILIPIYDNETFANRLQEIMKNPEEIQEKGKNARENSKKYQLDTVMGLWEQMFNDVMIKA